MVVHSFHIFDRRGKTLYTKRYSDEVLKQHQQGLSPEDEELLSEQRKLIFGMLFSLRELVGSLVPEGSQKGLHSIRTGASTLHNYETLSGLRLAMYTSNDVKPTTKSNKPATPSVREVLQHIYTELWVECVIRSPLYRVGSIDAESNSMEGKFVIHSTNFEQKLEEYFASIPWFR